MRELMIRFRDDGENYRELDESRNYFLSEAESLIEVIKVRLKNEKRVAVPKSFEFWLDGVQLMIDSVDFSDPNTLSSQIKQTIESHEGWEKEIRHKHLNAIEFYLTLERELLLQKPLLHFVKRFDQVLGSPDLKPFPCLIKLEQMKELFDMIFVHVATSFYSELEHIIEAVRLANETIVERRHAELLKADSKDYDNYHDYLKVRVMTWYGDNDNFLSFKKYVIACYQSVPKTRILALYPKFEPYQNLQKYLFIDFTESQGFVSAYELNQQLLAGFTRKYNDVLFSGFVIKNDEMIESLVLSPVVKLIKDTAESSLTENRVGDSHDEQTSDQKATV